MSREEFAPPISAVRADGKLIGELLRIPQQAVVNRCQEALLQAGYGDLRTAHMNVFIHLDHPPGGTRLTDLAERAQMTKQAMGEIVTTLEADGYVERIADPTDRRARLIRFTPRGWAVHETAPVIVRQLEEEWATRLGPAQYEQLHLLLRKLIAAIEDSRH